MARRIDRVEADEGGDVVVDVIAGDGGVTPANMARSAAGSSGGVGIAAECAPAPPGAHSTGPHHGACGAV